MRIFLLPRLACTFMPSRGNAFTFLTDETPWVGRGSRHALLPQHPDGDPLEMNDEPRENPPRERPPSFPEFPTDVPAPEPHDVPAWEPVDDPPPDPGGPQPKPRSIP